MSNEVFRKYTDEETFSKIVDYNNVSEMWDHCIKEYGDKIAVIDDGKEYTFKALDADVASFRTVLANNGIKVTLPTQLSSELIIYKKV